MVSSFFSLFHILLTRDQAFFPPVPPKKPSWSVNRFGERAGVWWFAVGLDYFFLPSGQSPPTVECFTKPGKVIIKRELIELKEVGNTSRQLTTPNESPRLLGDCSSLQISIFQIHQIFNISYFPQFNLSFEKKYLFPKMSKINQKFTQNRQTVVNEISREI